MTYMTTSKHVIPYSLGHEIYNFTPELSLLGEGGIKFNNFLSPYHTDATYRIWLNSRKEDVNGRRTQTDSNRS